MIETSRQGAVTVIQSEARFNDEFVELLQPAIEDCMGQGVPMAVIDLESTFLINSVGLEYLLDAGDQFRDKGGSLKLASPTPLCAEILAITELDCELEVYDNVNQAVRSFAK